MYLNEVISLSLFKHEREEKIVRKKKKKRKTLNFIFHMNCQISYFQNQGTCSKISTLHGDIS